ncbi:Ig-like domain-containing protein, partial [Acinetobacter gyllenbergii]|uniref:Ig-like domain-containing protein n=1 Tax=Acinetobacter gyllenbergii TaxID=134534 RepID=UPI003F57ED72
MTRIYLVDKNIHKTVTTTESLATMQLPLDQGLMAKFGMNPEQIFSIVRVGNNAVVHLKDGTQVILEGFFAQEVLSIPLQDGQSLWATFVEESAIEIPANDYLVLDGVPPNVVVSDSSVAPPESLTSEPPVAMGTNTAITANSPVGTTIPTWVLVSGGIAGIGVIAAASGSGDKNNGPAPDTTAPTQAQGGFAGNHEGKTITGQAEAGATVLVKDSAGKELAKTIVGADGRFSVTLVKALTNGEKVSITVKDSAGNESSVTSITAPDTTAPVQPQGGFTGNHEGKTITGQAEAGATVLVKDSVGKELAKTIVGVDGQFNITLVKALTNGEKVSITVKDSAGNESSVTSITAPDTTAPIAGVLDFKNLNDTGSSASDRITQDNSFDLSLSGQEVGTAVVYQVSKDGGAWTSTTVKQSDLSDGVYQFKAIVTDAAGNSSEVLSTKLTVDNTAPVAGTLSITHLNDTGSSASDRITQDNSFDLSLSGQEVGTAVVYQVSKDGGAWTTTTVKQSDLSDGVYQFKAIVTDAAGNSSEVLSTKLTVDNTAPVAGTLS